MKKEIQLKNILKTRLSGDNSEVLNDHNLLDLKQSKNSIKVTQTFCLNVSDAPLILKKI